MNEWQVHQLEPGQHVWWSGNRHELEVTEVEPNGEAWVWDLDEHVARIVSQYELEVSPR